MGSTGRSRGKDSRQLVIIDPPKESDNFFRILQSFFFKLFSILLLQKFPLFWPMDPTDNKFSPILNTIVVTLLWSHFVYTLFTYIVWQKGYFHPFPWSKGILSPLILHYHVVNPRLSRCNF